MINKVTILTALGALCIAPASWSQHQKDQRKSGDGLQVLSAQNIVVTDDEGGKPQTLEIRVVGDKVTVIRDGKEVPHAQVTEGDDRIVITDKDGNRLHEMTLRMQGDGAGRYFFGGGNVQGFKFDDEEGLKKYFADLPIVAAANPPAVMLGVQMGVPGPALEKHLQLEPGTTTLLTGLYEGLPAHASGLREFDIIIKVDGQSPADSETIRKVLAEKKPGDSIAFTVIQEGKQKDITVELKAYDADAMTKAAVIGESKQRAWTGFDGAPHLYQWFNEQPRVYFAPKSKDDAHTSIPKMELRGHQWQPAERSESLEQQLQRLDKRMAELERLMQKLAERRESNR